jgi:hypothetical protein
MPKRSRGLGRVTAGQSWSQGLGVSITWAGEMQETGTFGHSRKRVHVLPPVQAGRALPRAHSITCFTGFNSRIKSPKEKTKACVLEGMRSLNDPHQGSLPTVQTVKPLSRCTTPASRCKPSHPSPSAHQFRLPFNWLAPSELRRIFCSDEGAGAAIE